ncbi:MAG: DUF1848 domain-containing protein [Methanomicrobiales archaeon]|nr:DUF1848 domain-containing protein [Methanomicrobiales archaeon]
MKWRGWEKIPLPITGPGTARDHQVVQAVAPVIISASRSTDIPAFYGRWFLERLRAGYVKWKSPFGGSPVYVSFAKTRLVVFWTKNPAQFMQHLPSLDAHGLSYYFLFTLNDYDADGLESRVPPCSERIGTFIRLSQRIGKGKVVWRFDPLVLSDRITVEDLLDRARRIGDQVAPYTERMVFSFVDIEKYAKVKRNLMRGGFSSVREFTDDEIAQFCSGLRELNKRWGLSITACSEKRDLSAYGIGRGQCISYDLITREFGGDPTLMEFLHPEKQQTLAGAPSPADPSRRLKDPGQRNTCRCIVSKDIGQYSTCMHLCAYCYANSSEQRAAREYARQRADEDAGIFRDSISG